MATLWGWWPEGAGAGVLAAWVAAAALMALAALLVTGRIGAGAGVPDLFRDADDARLERGPGRWPLPDAVVAIWWSPAFAGQAFAVLWLGVLAVSLHPAPHTAPPWLLTLPAAALGAGLALIPRRGEVAEGDVRRRWIGWAVGVATVLGLAWVLTTWGASLQDWRLRLPGLALDLEMLRLVVLGLAVLLSVALVRSKSPLPASGIFGILITLTAAAGWAPRLDWQGAAAVGLLVAAWAAWRLGRAQEFKQTLPGLPLTEAARGGLPGSYAEPLDPNDPDLRLPPEPPLCDPVEALKAWRGGWAEGAKPKLVIFALSGGAYRASFWCGAVMDRLALESRPDGALAGLTGNVRLIAGASGGMVAGALFAARHGLPEGIADLDEGINACITFEVDDHQAACGRPLRGPRDSLTPVAAELLDDMARALVPMRCGTDRGRVLDAQWPTLARNFKAQAEAEAAGTAPALVFSPMTIESGSVMFVSNLDLGLLREHFPGEDKNRDSAELFKIWPEAQGRLTLATAVRLSASFPYVSPAVSLPTRPSRRLVDAGYYDNFGIDVATAFLNVGAVRRWVLEHCSGVAIIEMRAFPSRAEEKPAPNWLRAFWGLISPAQGLFAARGSSQTLRNREQVRLTRRLYGRALQAMGRAPDGNWVLAGRDFVKVFGFEYGGAASMSWHLNRAECEDIARAAEAAFAEAAPQAGGSGDAARAQAATDAANRETARRLRAFWAGDAAAGRDDARDAVGAGV